MTLKENKLTLKQIKERFINSKDIEKDMVRNKCVCYKSLNKMSGVWTIHLCQLCKQRQKKIEKFKMDK